MAFRWLVNAGLIAIPIGATLGVLLGIDSHRYATGQAPLFNGGDGSPGSSVGGGGGSSGGGGSTGGGGSGGGTSDNGVTISQYCQRFYGISPPAKGEEFTLNPNQWGWTVGTAGGLCMNVTTFDNETYPTTNTAPAFSVTWQYPVGPESAPVHAFPNIKTESKALPAPLQNLSRVDLDVHWTYGVGDVPVSTTDETGMTQEAVVANVAIDMFVDADQTNAQNSTKAKYEIMVWFADFTPAVAQPLGLALGIKSTQVINGTTFNLYADQNDLQQTVLTWLASTTTEVFVGDISPLITELTSLTSITVPSETDYLGYFAFGSETFSSSANVTFAVPMLSIDIET